MTTYLDPASRTNGVRVRGEKSIAAAFLLMVRRLRAQATDPDAIAAGAEPLDQLEATAQLLGNAWSEHYVDAGKATGLFVSAALSGRRVVQKLEITVLFDQTNDRAAAEMKANTLWMVRQFSAEQRAATREALNEAIAAGANPREAARAFRNSIGLTRRQLRAVANFRRLLEANSSEALTRALRDKRFDSTLRRAASTGEPLTQAQIDRMVDRYYERMVKHRAEVIARTESLRSTHAGTQELYQQAIDAGQLRQGDVVRTWVTAKDERVRDFDTSSTSHAIMDGQQVGVNQLFTSGAGNQALHPGAFGVAEDDVQCRCAVTTRFTDAAVAAETPAGISFEIIGG